MQLLVLIPAVGVVIDLSTNRRLDFGDSLLQIGEMGVESLTHGLLGHQQAIVLLGTHDLEGIPSRHEGA